MFFLFLVGLQSIDSALKALQNKVFYCPHCHNTSMQGVRHMNFISVFFVPIIPVYFSKRLRCTICNYSRKITKAEIQEMQQTSQSYYGTTQPHYY